MHIVLVHGFLDSARIMAPIARHLTYAGHACVAPTLKPSHAGCGLAVLAGQLERFIAATLPAGARFALVGYSMGALIARYYVQELGGDGRVDAFFSLAGPHAGTRTAYLGFGRGVIEMRPGSAFLRELAATASRLKGIPVTCYWSPVDPMIVPAASARLSETEHVRLPWSLHPLLTFDRRVHRDIARRLDALDPSRPRNVHTC